MKRYILAAALAVFAIPSWAADVPYKAPAPKYADPLFSWSGFYLGAHVTGAWQDLSPQAIAINKVQPSGWGGGPQLMALYQFPHYTVVGVIADADITSNKANIQAGGGTIGNIKGDFQGTLRAVLGYAGFAQGFLPYVTAGIAGQKNNATIASFKSESTAWGWVVGGGAMFAIPKTDWSLYVEGLYLGDANSVFPIAGVTVGTKTTETTVKGGLFYKM